jgi:hypothetical protein
MRASRVAAIIIDRTHSIANMTEIRTAFIVLLAALAGCSKTDTVQQQAVDEVPMPASHQIPVTLVSNYAFMGQMASKGDGRSFSSFYVDTATLARSGYQPVTGQFAIRDLIRNGDEWGLIEWTRLSEGFKVEGRDVIDSGKYVLFHARPMPPNSIDPAGRYRTRWTVSKKGEWVILWDSLFGGRK